METRSNGRDIYAPLGSPVDRTDPINAKILVCNFDEILKLGAFGALAGLATGVVGSIVAVRDPRFMSQAKWKVGLKIFTGLIFTTATGIGQSQFFAETLVVDEYRSKARDINEVMNKQLTEQQVEIMKVYSNWKDKSDDMLYNDPNIRDLLTYDSNKNTQQFLKENYNELASSVVRCANYASMVTTAFPIYTWIFSPRFRAYVGRTSVLRLGLNIGVLWFGFVGITLQGLNFYNTRSLMIKEFEVGLRRLRGN